MSRRIANLLDQSEELVTKLINQLEAKNGYPSHDARFLAENIQKIRFKMHDLKLDPDDTTGEELYQALLNRFERHSRIFDGHFRAKNMSFDDKSVKAAELITKNIKLPQQWALKNPVAKDIIRKKPPKRVMKYLNYRSVDSLLKRECLSEIYVGAQLLESSAWHKSFNKLVSKLDQTDFELRPIKIQNLSFNKWRNVNNELDFVIRDDILATVGILPNQDLENAPLLTLTLLLIEELNSYEQIKSTHSLVGMGGLVMWWIDMDHLVASLAQEYVSLSLKDNALNFLHSKPYDERSMKHGRISFWRELINRYNNLPEMDGIFDHSVKEKIAKLRFKAPEPAHEFAEDF